MSKGTVTIYNVMASNDALDDWNIHMVVAIDHDKQEVIDGDISEILLERRLRRDGWTINEQEDCCDVCDRQYLRFTDYGGRDDGSGLVVGWQAGKEKWFEQSEAMPMWFADDDLPDEVDDDEECYWTVISEKLGRITFQSIDLEEVK